MAVFQGRSGADAIAKALTLICGTLKRYSNKLDVAITLTEEAGLINTSQAVTARQFVGTASLVCDIFKIVADNSGFYPPA